MTEALYDTKDIYVCRNKVAKPNVFIPVFPGTNCEYDSRKAFERAGANVVTKVFKNMSADDIRESVEAYREEIAKAQIEMCIRDRSQVVKSMSSIMVFLLLL